MIELLTVIAIIGILTALLTVSFISVRQRARDTQRKADIKQIQSALELYRADNDSYPTTAGVLPTTCGSAFIFNSVTYMPKYPCDPSTAALYVYSQTSSTSYVIGSCLENTNDIKDGTATKPAWMPACTPAYYYVSQNP